VDISNGGETMTGAVSRIDTNLQGSGWNPAYVGNGGLGGANAFSPHTMFCFTLSSPSAITWLQGSIQIWEGR